MSIYLTLVEVLAIHSDQINLFGGTHGLRDAGALEAAVFRCQSGYYADTISEAAALWESLAQNHAFLDGNKRVAFACTYTFLRINGLVLITNSDEAFGFINELYTTNSFRIENLEPWLRARVSKS